MKIRTPAILFLNLILLSGCGNRQPTDPASVIQLRFNSANSITSGSRVELLGTVVGEVSNPPEISPDGKSVVITATLKNLPEHLKSRVNSRTTAIVESTQLVAGQKILTLWLSERSDAKSLNEGAILEGMNNQRELILWKMINLLSDPPSEKELEYGRPWWGKLAGLIYPMNPETIGSAMMIFNLICFILIILVMASMLLDALHKLFLKNKRKDKGSPKILRSIWILFALTSSVRILLLFAAFVISVIGSNLPAFPPYLIFPESPITLLQWEVKFIVIFVVILSLKFKFKLFLLPLQFLR